MAAALPADPVDFGLIFHTQMKVEKQNRMFPENNLYSG